MSHTQANYLLRDQYKQEKKPGGGYVSEALWCCCILQLEKLFFQEIIQWLQNLPLYLLCPIRLRARFTAVVCGSTNAK